MPWCQGGAGTSLGSGQLRRVCPQSPGSTGHVAGFLKRHFLSRDIPAPSHSRRAGSIQPMDSLLPSQPSPQLSLGTSIPFSEALSPWTGSLLSQLLLRGHTPRVRLS